MNIFKNKIKKPTIRKQPDFDLISRIHKELLLAMFVDKIYQTKGLTIEGLAKLLNTNREYLSQIINKNYGTFTTYINKHRILDSIEMITTPKYKYTIAAIANKVGFTSISSFIDAFKKETGTTPSKFKKMEK